MNIILEMNGNCTKITNPEDGNKRDFNFDYSFWSHDGFIINEDVYNIIKLFYTHKKFIYYCIWKQIILHYYFVIQDFLNHN